VDFLQTKTSPCKLNQIQKQYMKFYEKNSQQTTNFSLAC